MEIPPEYRRAAGWKTGRQRPEKLLPRERSGRKAPCVRALRRPQSALRGGLASHAARTTGEESRAAAPKRPT